MALPFYMTLKGESTGDIEGCCTAAGHETEVQCHALEQSIKIPYDPKTGQPSGLRIHGPIKLIKSFDKASPLLYKAMVDGERMSEVVLSFYRILSSGSQENYFTITLSGATIVEIRPHMLNHFDPEQAKYDNMEEICFTYARIEWRWMPDGLSTMDENIRGL